MGAHFTKLTLVGKRFLASNPKVNGGEQMCRGDPRGGLFPNEPYTNWPRRNYISILGNFN